MSDENNPEATTQPPAEDTAAAVAPAADAPPPAEAAPEGNPPVVDGIIRLRAPDGALYDYSIDSFDVAAAQEVYTLLPATWQQKIDAQAAFFENYQRTITEIPEELRAPGALEKLLKQIHEQGGYLSEETSPAVRAFLDGPQTAELRNSGLFKGYQTADVIGNILAAGANFVGSVPARYIDALGLPYRGLIYAGTKVSDQLSSLTAVSHEQAMTMATAYQGMMYMATESEFAPKETKTEAPGTVGTAVGGVQSAFNYVAVGGIAIWNLVTGWITGEKVTWDQAWKDAENYWTDGKGLKSAEETAQTNAVAASLEEVRPAVEQRLLQSSVGSSIAPYLGVEQGSLIVGNDGNVSTFNGQDTPTTPVLGPDGTTPLQASAIEQSNLEAVQAGLFMDRSPSGLAASAVGLAGAGLAARGAAQGFARTTLTGDLRGVEKAHAAAARKLALAEKAADDFLAGKKNANWLGKQLDPKALQALGDSLDADLNNAQKAYDSLDQRLTTLKATDPIADAKVSSNPFTRTMGNLAEGANKKLPADASFLRKAGNFVTTSFGRFVGELTGHTWNGTTSTVAKVGNGIISAIDNSAPVPSGIRATAGRWLTRGLNMFAPVYTASQTAAAIEEGDTTGAIVHGTQTAAIGGTMAAFKIAKLGVSRSTPIVGALVSGGEFVNAAAHGDSKGMWSAGTDLGLIGGGAAIGAGIGLLGGPFAPVTSTAGAAVGATVGGIAVAGRAVYNMFWGGNEPVAQPVASAPTTPRTTPAPQVAAAVVKVPQSIASLELTQEELNAIMQSRMAVRTQASTGKTGFDAVAFARVSANSAAASRNG